MSNAFQNAYDFAIEYVMDMSEARGEDLSETTIFLDAEQALRDWDLYGPRRTGYKPEEYALTDSQWYDCEQAVQETAEARLWDKLTR